jgi:hypothetical protein
MTVIGKKERGGEGYGDDVPNRGSRVGHNNSPALDDRLHGRGDTMHNGVCAGAT